jgi:hypothetical protein
MARTHRFLAPILVAGLAACTAPPPEAGRAGEPPVDEIVRMLAERDFAGLGRHVDAEGLRLSPYLTILPDSLRLSPAELARCADDTRIRQWGTWDGQGDPIRMTCAEYFDRLVWVADFRAVRETAFDRPLAGGTDIDNHRALYPNAVIAWRYRPEYRDAAGYHPWQSLHLVFARRGGEWRLLAIARGTRTI